MKLSSSILWLSSFAAMGDAFPRHLKKSKKSSGSSGDDNMKLSRFPYFVYFKDAPCAGSLIAPDVVLTSAQCMGKIKSAEVGRYDLSVVNEVYEVFDVIDSIVNPGWDGSPSSIDLMLVSLSGMSAMPLLSVNDNADTPSIGEDLKAIGFGYKNGIASTMLDEVVVKYAGGSSDKLETNSTSDGDPCLNDSGSPIFVEGKSSDDDLLVGVASLGFACDGNTAKDLSQRVSSQTQWIKETVCGLSASPPEYFFCSQETLVPTAVTTSFPSGRPSLSPVVETLPTLIPTSIAAPTDAPTIEASSIPSHAPSLIPSASPSTFAPTVTPTASPSTRAPTVTPTASPSTRTPTVTPTASPSTRAPTVTPTSKPSAAEESSTVTLTIVFDDHPDEIGWSIEDLTTSTIVVRRSPGTYELGTKLTLENIDLVDGHVFVFSIEDTVGDGLCCDEPGSYTLTLGDTVLATGEGNFGSFNFATFKLPPPPTPTLAPTIAATTSPVNKPPATDEPTDAPSIAPTLISSESPSFAPSTHPSYVPTIMAPTSNITVVLTVNVFIQLDDFPIEIGWAIEDITSGEIVVRRPPGTYGSLTAVADEDVELLGGRNYLFAIEDHFGDGLCCEEPGFYSVTLGETILAYGKENFGFSESTFFRLPGAEPTEGPTSVSTPSPAPTLPQTPQPSTPQPTTPQPSTPQPTTPQPTTPQPTTPQPTTPQPTTPQPTTPQPVTVQPTALETLTVNVFIQFDDFPQDIGWSIEDVTTGQVVVQFPTGSYSEGTDVVDENVELIGGHIFFFGIEDSVGNGLCCDDPGFYSVTLGEQVLASGEGDFGFFDSVAFRSIATTKMAPPPHPRPRGSK